MARKAPACCVSAKGMAHPSPLRNKLPCGYATQFGKDRLGVRRVKNVGHSACPAEERDPASARHTEGQRVMQLSPCYYLPLK